MILLRQMSNLQKAIENSLEEINDFLSDDKKIAVSFDDILIGPEGILDSLSTATFLLELENQYTELTGENVDFTEMIISEDGLVKNFKISDIRNLLKDEK